MAVAEIWAEGPRVPAPCGRVNVSGCAEVEAVLKPVKSSHHRLCAKVPLLAYEPLTARAGTAQGVSSAASSRRAAEARASARRGAGATSAPDVLMAVGLPPRARGALARRVDCPRTGSRRT